MKGFYRSMPVPRSFQCRMCGDEVTVTERGDRRHVFCCEACERRYWRHADRYARRAQNEVGHATNEWLDRRVLEQV